MNIPIEVREPKVLLDLGAGKSRKLQGEFPSAVVIRVDIDPATRPDVCCDIRMLPFANESIDWASSEHTLEHIPWPFVDNALAEWVRVIKLGGLLKVSVPDLGWLAQKIVEGQMTVGLVAGVFGSQMDDYQRHLSGFTMSSLAGLMQNAGLEIVETDRKDCLVLSHRHPAVMMTEVVQELFVIGKKLGGKQ